MLETWQPEADKNTRFANVRNGRNQALATLDSSPGKAHASPRFSGEEHENDLDKVYGLPVAAGHDGWLRIDALPEFGRTPRSGRRGITPGRR